VREKIQKLVRENIANLKNYKPGKPVEELKRELGIDEAVKLASNENPLGASPLAIKALKKNLNGIYRYPDGSCYYLRKKLAQSLGTAEESLIFGNGSDEIIVMALRAFIKPGDEVIICQPTFLIYRIAALAVGAKVITVPAQDFKYDLTAMLKAITPRTKMIFIANPNNPTSTYVTKDELDAFMKEVPDEVITFIDEAYYEFVEEPDFPSGLEYVKGKPVIVTRTFSKCYGLAGLRVGYGISDPEIVNCLNKVREPFNVNSLAQVAAIAALDDDAHLARSRKIIQEGRGYLTANFERLNLKVVPSAANFILVLIKNSCRIAEELLKKGLIVRSMESWGINDAIRVTIGQKKENQQLIKALEKLL